MKKVSAASVAPIITCLLLAGIHDSDAAKDTVTVPYDDIDFAISHYDDGRTSPYAVMFTSDVGVKSVFRFAKDGFVTDVEADDESYKLVYDGNGDLTKVKRTSSRRKLAEEMGEGGGAEKNAERTSLRGQLVDQTDEDAAGKTVKDTASRRKLVEKTAEGGADKKGRRTSSGGKLDAAQTERGGAGQTVKRSSSRVKMAADQADSYDMKKRWKRTPQWHYQPNVNSESDNISDVPVEELTSSVQQWVKESEGGDANYDVVPVPELTPAGRRRLYEDCEDCEQTWETVCGNGVETVCNLDGNGGPILSTAQGSIEVFCTTFGNLCAERTASEVCDGECGEEREEEEEECLPPFTITLEWSAGVEGLGGDLPLLELYVIEPGGQTASGLIDQTDMGIMSGDFSGDSSIRTYTMFEGLDRSGSSTFIAFAEWVEGFAPIDWTIVATLGDGRSVTTAEGQFTGDCSASSTSSSTYSNSDHGTSRGTTRLMYVELFEYIDNGCQLVV